MRRRSHSSGTWPRLLAALALLIAATVSAAPASGEASGAGASRWQARGEGLGAQAAWQMPGDGAGLIMQCDRGGARVLLRIEATALPSGLDKVSLVADGIGMDYPLDRSSSGGYVSRIALDAPILDRMLVARSFTLYGGGRVVQTGTPGEALARVVRACRDLHWPREARIDPSEAGLAKK